MPSGPMPIDSRRPRDPDATRAALLTAAGDLFARLGFDGATVDAIAKSAGVNKAMINYHFGGKRGLYSALLLADLDPVFRDIAEIRRIELPARERLARYVTVFGALHRDRPNVAILLLREVLAGGSRLEADLLPRFVSVLETVREIVEQGIREGAFRRVDPFLTHLTVVGSLLFFFASRPFRDRVIAKGKTPLQAPPDPDAYVALVRDLVLRGLAADPAPPEES